MFSRSSFWIGESSGYLDSKLRRYFQLVIALFRLGVRCFRKSFFLSRKKAFNSPQFTHLEGRLFIFSPYPNFQYSKHRSDRHLSCTLHLLTS